MASPLAKSSNEQLLTGWGRTAPTGATVTSVSNEADVQAAVKAAGPRGILARGLGRSYGDAAQASGGTVLDTAAMRTISLDASAGVVTAGAGASMDSIMQAIIPAGFFVPVTAGTRQVTLGGAIAADIHGKNHHVDGSFGNHVTSMRVVDGGGEIRELTPADAGFWATVGGMGLTGVVTEASFSCIPITSSLVSVDTERVNDLDAVMASMIERDADYRYSVAWIDTVHPSGRGVITRGDHADISIVPSPKREKATTFTSKALATAPGFIPGGLLNALTVRAFNEAWYRKAPKHREGELQSIGAFFHPLDGVKEWNRVYGPGGFLQYQFVVPDSHGHLVRRTLEALRGIGALSFLTVLKRFGPGNAAPLSFPQPGWTLALDVPATVNGLGPLLDSLDEEVADAGGRLYLAKDSRMSPAMFRRTYPRFPEWQGTRNDMDPNGTFTSDLARRLNLIGSSS